MSPEQIQQGNTDTRSDIFSFGVTVYEMLSGQRPFTASFSMTLMAEILHSETEEHSGTAARGAGCRRGDCEKVPSEGTGEAMANRDHARIGINAEAYRQLARACCFVEEYREAFESVRIAQRLDPMSPGPYFTGATVALGAGDWELAVRESHRAIELAPASPHGYYDLGLAEHFQGLHESAMEHMRRAVHLSDRHPSALVGLAMLIAQSGARASELEELLNELRDDATRAEATPYDFAEFYAGVGDIELAMSYLKRGVELRLPEMIGIRADPVLRSVRNHPEFSGLLDAIGLSRDEPSSPDESRTVASTMNKLTQ
jgi:serine/threonine protein kinase